MEDSDIIRKVKALLAKAQAGGVTEAESMAFADAAKRLMDKYNIDHDDIDDNKIDDLHQKKRIAENWEANLASATARMFNCGYYQERFRKPNMVNPDKLQEHMGHVFVGRENDRLTAELMNDFFCGVVKKLASEWARDNNGSTADKKIFMRTCALRLIQRIKEASAFSDQQQLAMIDENIAARTSLGKAKRHMTISGRGGEAGWKAGDGIGINVQAGTSGGRPAISEVRKLS